MTTVGLSSLRDRLYARYASQHAGRGNKDAVTLVYRRGIRPALSAPEVGPIIDIGCGSGELVRQMTLDGYDVTGVDISPEQVEIARAAGIERVFEGNYVQLLAKHPGSIAAITATDLLEHLAKEEVLQTFDQVARALLPGGTFIARVPNAGSPFGGHIQYGDFTHESFFTPRSVRQLAIAAGFEAVRVVPCAPAAHGLVSLVRVALWRAISGFYKAALAVETGSVRGHVVTQNFIFVASVGE